MTPEWAASWLVEAFFADLTDQDVVLEPTCGEGAFLAAIPPHVHAIGIELDPELAAVARERTGRQVIVGDARMVDLPVKPTVIIGNPPFERRLVEQILERCYLLLPDGGRVAMVLPAFVLQTASTVHRLAQVWHVRQQMLPRNLFPRLQHPLCFVQLTKSEHTGLEGFALYEQVHQVSKLRARYRQLLAQGVRSTWAAVVQAALEQLGGRASLQELYHEIDGHRPTNNAFWHAKVRQTLQCIAYGHGNGVWELPGAATLPKVA
ncbi:SAM-dependent methyltransferase [Pseudoxanthomonas kaohsiungensis]|nr:SAM-dependent methyltransferase [Pseudoxanthomonas kaohsiungensis]